MSTTLYKLGFQVGQILKQIHNQKLEKKIIFDQQDGSPDGDGITSPTSNFMNALYSANKYYHSIIDVQKVTGSVVYAGYTTINNMIYFEIDSSKTSSLSITFSVVDKDSQTVGSIWFQNCYVVFKNVTFNLPSELNPLTANYVPSIPLSFIGCTVIFSGCTFRNNSTSPNITFMNLVGSNVYLESCTLNGNSFTLACSTTHPSLISLNYITNNAGAVYKDSNSKWIMYSNS